ncbi:hypothetical protein T492DRAFT_1110317 [Pavlovales sp. CCMP2436]|nr:hypothetical protein T492DRAFT_1110317 [Pavlovales sp. CCMP2436]
MAALFARSRLKRPSDWSTPQAARSRPDWALLAHPGRADFLLPAAMLERGRQQADPVFDRALEADDLDDTSDAVYRASRGQLEKIEPGAPTELSQAIAELAQTPAWVDWAQIARGQQVFVRYLPAAVSTLYYVSLVGGFSAERIARVVSSTGYLGGGRCDVLARIAETAAFVALVTQPESLHPHQPGWTAAVRVRLLHARVRRRLYERGWDAPINDVPINMVQIAATQLAFSLSILTGIERLAPGVLKESAQEDYLHLWRFIGYLLGVSDEHNACTSMGVARSHLESYLADLIQPGPHGCQLAQSILSLRLPSGQPSGGLGKRACLCRKFIGDALSDGLGLPTPTRRDVLLASVEWTILAAYTRVCALPIAGCPLLLLHAWLLRQVAASSSRFTFPLRRQPHPMHFAAQQSDSMCPLAGLRGSAAG